MFGPSPTAWIERLIRMPRSRRVYKPAMLLAALDAIDAGATAAHIPLDDLLDRFDDLLERSGLRGRGRGLRRGRGRGRGGGSALFDAADDDLQHRHDVPLGDEQRDEAPSGRSGDLLVGLVGRDLEDRLAFRDHLALANEPLGDGALGDALP